MPAGERTRIRRRMPRTTSSSADTGRRFTDGPCRMPSSGCREHAGMRRTDGGRYQPRLHDLRHTFAVHRLTEWYRQGADVQRLVYDLSVYLGHARLAHTQVYLTMTPELAAAGQHVASSGTPAGRTVMRDPSLLGPWIRRFLMEHLVSERNLARNTQRSYRDTLQLLLPAIARRPVKPIDRLAVIDVSADRVRQFLSDLEEKRGCGIATRNQRWPPSMPWPGSSACMLPNWSIGAAKCGRCRSRRLRERWSRT